MTDITLCRTTTCELKSKCYRFTAKTSKRMQSYADFREDKDKECVWFWEAAFTFSTNLTNK